MPSEPSRNQRALLANLDARVLLTHLVHEGYKERHGEKAVRAKAVRIFARRVGKAAWSREALLRRLVRKGIAHNTTQASALIKLLGGQTLAASEWSRKAYILEKFLAEAGAFETQWGNDASAKKTLYQLDKTKLRY